MPTLAEPKPLSPTPIAIGLVNLARLIPWGPRKAAVAKFLDGMALDIICIQECPEWEDDLVRLMSGRWIIIADHVNCVILVRAELFEKVGPDLNIFMQGYGRKRYAVGADVKRLEDGLRFTLANLHPSNTGEYPGSGDARLKRAEMGRTRQAGEAWAALDGRHWVDEDDRIIIVGDTNTKLKASDGGLPGVFVGHGLTDMLVERRQEMRIDRGFQRGFVTTDFQVFETSSRISDHDFVRFIVRVPVASTPVARAYVVTRPVTVFNGSGGRKDRAIGYPIDTPDRIEGEYLITRAGYLYPLDSVTAVA